MAINGVVRELLVRYLDTWTPTALHAAKRVTFALVDADPDTADTALRVFAEFADRLRGRRLTMIVIAPEPPNLDGLLDELRTPPGLTVSPAAGEGSALITAALKAAGAPGAPLLAYLRAVPEPPLAAIAAGRPAEVLLLGPVGDWTGCRTSLLDAGFSLTAGVELVADTESMLLAFATSSAKSLEAFKNAMWAVDEYAGVRYRDPHDPSRHLLDISIKPHPGPLRLEILAHLATAGPQTVTDLRRFTMTETVYRPSDLTSVLTTLLHAGSVRREPEGGRLGGDTTIALPG